MEEERFSPGTWKGFCGRQGMQMMKVVKSFNKEDGFIALALLLLLSPNIFHISVEKDIQTVIRKFGFICFSFSLIFAPIFLFHKNIKVYLWIFFPFILLAPLNLFFIYLFKSSINVGIFSAVMQTNLYEALEFISGLRGILVFIMILILVYGIIYVWVVFKINKHCHPLMSFILSVGSITYICLLFFIPQTPSKNNIRFNRFEEFMERLNRTYPYGIVLNFIKYYKEVTLIKNHLEVIKKIKTTTYQKNDVGEKEIYILMIGEAARYDHFSINQYGRDTSPHLRSMNDLINFTDVCASGTDTIMSLPLILTKTNPPHLYESYKQPSFISYLKKAGFKTYWISNDIRIDKYSTTASVFAEEADHVIYLNEGFHKMERNKLDEEMLPVLDKILSDFNENKLFIILHTMGNHYRYDLRYPPHFDVFQPSMKGKPDVRFDDPGTKIIKVASYDNSILYTDYIISSVINRISRCQGVGVAIYVSDHGEDIFDEGRNLFGHGSKEITTYVAHVPLFVWVSELYKSKFPQKTATLLKNRNKKISNANIFYSILDMASIHYDGEDLSKSIFSDTLKFYRREIISTDNRIIDCDTLK